MASPAERQRWRDEILIAIYNVSGADPTVDLDGGELQQLVDVPEDEFQPACRYLVDRYFVEAPTMEGFTGPMTITNTGIQRAEDLLGERPDTASSSGEILNVAEVRSLEPVIALLVEIKNSDLDELEPNDKADLLAQVSTAQAQYSSPRPMRRVFQAVLGSIGRIAEQAAGSALGPRLAAAAAAGWEAIGG
jgi:hypothetical protein